MNSKEKAKELVERYANTNGVYGASKRCALIAVEEIIKSQTCCDNFECKHEGSVILKWWGDVKREIEKL